MAVNVTGAGLYLDPNEEDIRKVVAVVRQLIEGRSNGVGSVTLTGDGATTTTTVTSASCGAGSAIILFPTTANASSKAATTYVSSVARSTFTITHAATSNPDETFAYICVG